jgi:hypothetical protein
MFDPSNPLHLSNEGRRFDHLRESHRHRHQPSGVTMAKKAKKSAKKAPKNTGRLSDVPGRRAFERRPNAEALLAVAQGQIRSFSS